MKISVIIPFYNEITLICRAVESVVENLSAYTDYEIIICNDGVFSTEEIERKLLNTPVANVRIIKNYFMKGPGGARNTGLDAAIGDYIAFLDADDYWLPGKIDSQLAAMQAGATFVATSYRFESLNAIVRPPNVVNQPIDVFLRRGIGTSTVMISRSLLEGRRFKDIRFAQDIDFWYALADAPKFNYASVEKCYAVYSTGGSTRNKWIQLKYFYEILRLNGVPQATKVYILTSYILSGIYNHYLRRLTKQFIISSRRCK